MHVALLEIKKAGNLGAICRVMKNFGLNNLILINPQCDPLDEEAVKRAKHAKDILKKAKVVKNISYLKKFDYIIGTTSMLGTDSNIPRSPLTPRELEAKSKNSVILFGREDSGLSNKEVMLCDIIVTVPTSKKYATMNISHAATIIFYELFNKSRKKNIKEHIGLARRKERDTVLKLIYAAIDKIPFPTEDKKETQRVVWKKILGKCFLTKREAFALCGFFKRVNRLYKK